MRVLLAVLLIGIAGCGGGDSLWVVDPVVALEKDGAKFKRNDQGEVVEVSLELTKITDAGLVHLKGLTNLQTLNLRFTKVTDVGLEHLKGLTELQTLSLPGRITDAGLVHLKGLTNLQTLDLIGNNVTAAGVADLQKALPNCKIAK